MKLDNNFRVVRNNDLNNIVFQDLLLGMGVQL